jgi:serine/threonine protein kinase
MTDASMRIDRYKLLELISVHAPVEQFDGYRQFPTELWRGHDDVLDRSVSIRLMRKDDSRVNRVLGAARAAALVDDRRLLRILDVMDVPGSEGQPARTAIISEWADGQHLAERLTDGNLFDPTVAVQTIAEVARALANCHRHDVAHGRLRPTSVLWTEAGELRIRGLAVDAALFGPIDPAAPDADVDGLGSLLYAMVTGRWPALTIDAPSVHIPLAPATGRTVPMPSRVRAGVPSDVDDLVTRSVRQVARPRGSMPIASVEGFATAAGSVMDYLAPVGDVQSTSVGARIRTAATAATSAITTTQAPVTYPDSDSESTTRADIPRRRVGIGAIISRLVAVAFAIALTLGIGWFGWQQLVGGPAIDEQATGTEASILETEAVPFEENFDSGLTAVLPIESVRSYDPLGDSNGDGQPDGADGKERNPRAQLAADSDGTTAWLTRKYDSPNVGSKGGVGLIVDLGSPKQLATVELDLIGFGTDLDVRVADQILDDPDLWTEFASVNDAGPEIVLRSPRSVIGQYVLIWLTGLPVIPDTTNTDDPRYQGGIRQVSITGTDPRELVEGE